MHKNTSSSHFVNWLLSPNWFHIIKLPLHTICPNFPRHKKCSISHNVFCSLYWYACRRYRKCRNVSKSMCRNVSIYRCRNVNICRCRCLLRCLCSCCWCRLRCMSISSLWGWSSLEFFLCNWLLFGPLNIVNSSMCIRLLKLGIVL